MPRPAKLSPSLPSVSERPETPTKPNINGFTRTGFYQAQNRPIRPVMSGRLKTVKEVCEASVSSLESMKEEPSLVPSRERESLRRQYEQAIFQGKMRKICLICIKKKKINITMASCNLFFKASNGNNNNILVYLFQI